MKYDDPAVLRCEPEHIDPSRCHSWRAAAGIPLHHQGRDEIPAKIGQLDPSTGSLSALAANQVEGAKWTIDGLSKKGGILVRLVQLLVEDSANDTGTGVQTPRKLIECDSIDAILGDANCGIAYAVMGVTAEKKVLRVVPDGHTDTITGTGCKRGAARRR